MTDQAASTPPTFDLRHEIIETARTLGTAILVVLIFRALVFQPFTIPSSSMEPGLVTGDYVVVSKFAYGWSRASLPFNPPVFEGRAFGRLAARGDVVVFRLPRDPGKTWVKRVIGLPGDRVQVIGGAVLVNGRALEREILDVTQDHDRPERTVLQVREHASAEHSYITWDGGSGHPGDDTGVYVVPPGHYFMMGDNRDNSLDSRWPGSVGVGLLPIENVVGKAELVLASWKPGASLFKPWTWLNLQWDRFFQPVR